MNNNRGFTLIELLAVFVILFGISLVSVASITSSLERNDKQKCSNQIELVKNAAKIYFSLTDDAKCPSVTDKCVLVKTLVNDNYFNDNSKLDKLNVASDYVTIKDGVIKFNSNGTCKE